VIKLGYKASAEQFAPGKLLGFSCLAEEVGFDSVFISDHFQPWKHVDGHAPFSLTWLGALGARTSRVVIGTSVLTPTFRYHPSIVAQAFGTMGAMFPGRVVLGIGTGEGLNEVPSTGQPWPEFKERFARLRESVTLIRALWTQERVSFEGQYYKTEKATIYDRPEAPVPIYVAAAGALALVVATLFVGASGVQRGKSQNQSIAVTLLHRHLYRSELFANHVHVVRCGFSSADHSHFYRRSRLPGQ